MKILIVCSSNTCRSPYAEFIFKRLVSESDVLKKNIESVTSSAVFNQSRAMHPKTYALLLEEGFAKEELDAFKPDFILKDRKKFDEADVIIGMGYLQWFLLPFKYKKKIRQSFKSRHRKKHQHSRSVLQKVDGILQKYDGRHQDLSHRLCRKT